MVSVGTLSLLWVATGCYDPELYRAFYSGGVINPSKCHSSVTSIDRHNVGVGFPLGPATEDTVGCFSVAIGFTYIGHIKYHFSEHSRN